MLSSGKSSNRPKRLLAFFHHDGRKTPKSLSDSAKLLGRPKNFRITVNELRISAGAGFVVVICGNIMTMPGLPKVPAAARIKILPDGRAVGLS